MGVQFPRKKRYVTLEWPLKRFEWSNRLDTALYKKIRVHFEEIILEPEIV